MKVIFIKDLKKQGKVNEIKERKNKKSIDKVSRKWYN